MCLFELFCVFFWLELHPGSVSDLGLAMPVTQSLSLSGFPAFNSRHSLGKEKISWVMHYSPDYRCVSDTCLCHFSTSHQSIIQTDFIAPPSSLNFAQHHFMDLELLVLEGGIVNNHPVCVEHSKKLTCKHLRTFSRIILSRDRAPLCLPKCWQAQLLFRRSAFTHSLPHIVV